MLMPEYISYIVKFTSLINLPVEFRRCKMHLWHQEQIKSEHAQPRAIPPPPPTMGRPELTSGRSCRAHIVHTFMPTDGRPDYSSSASPPSLSSFPSAS